MEEELSMPINTNGLTVECLIVLTMGEISKNAASVTELNRNTANTHLMLVVYSLLPFLKYRIAVTSNPKIIQSKINHQG